MIELLDGFASVLTPVNLMYAAIGVILGTFVGMLPGIGPALTIALLLPVTTTATDQTSMIGALIMFGGIYAGAMYGGSTTSILLNTPGESNSVATAFEGYQMARRGRAKSALATAAIGSFVAGTLSVIALSLFAVPLAKVAVLFRASDDFALALLAMVSVTALMGKSLLRGMISLTFGLFLGTIGMDRLFGAQRLTLWQYDWAQGFSSDLTLGISITTIIVGLFAIGESLYTSGRLHRLPTRVAPLSTKGQRGWMTREDWRRSWKPWLRGTGLGFPFGILPAGGAEIPTFMSYTIEKRRAKKYRKQFGKGAIEGVAGPEAANNSAFTGVLVPLLTLGLPTSATAAVMLSAFNSFNIPVGPSLFEGENSIVVWSLIASLYIGNIMLLILNLPLIKLWVQVLRIPRPLLFAGILLFALVGITQEATTTFMMLVTVAIGVIAVFMRMFGFPIAPVILGVILGPMLDESFRKAVEGAAGDLSIFWTRPLTLSLLGLTLLSLVLPYLPRIIAKAKGRKAEKLAIGDDD